MQNKIDTQTSQWAKFFSGIWILLCILLGTLYKPESISFGDIGAYLSGIFAPLAWLWFYLSHKSHQKELQLQREELTFQRQSLDNQTEELRLQRKALDNQVNAQEISAKALQKQLEITEKQFLSYQEELQGKKPLFILKKTQPTIRIYDNSDEPNNFNPIEKSIKLVLIVKNIAGDAKPKKMRAFFEHIEFQNYTKQLNYENTRDEQCAENFQDAKIIDDEYEVSITLTNSSFRLLDRDKLHKKATKLLDNLILEIHYSYSYTSSNDKYELEKDKNGYRLIKLSK